MNISELKSQYPFMDNVIDGLSIAIENGLNILLYGRGGFGKSEISSLIGKIFFEESDIFVMSLNSSTTEEKILGGIDIKRYKDQGILTYLYENSFMNYKFVIFEEMFDASPDVLCVLKDILTSGYHRDGVNTFKMRCRTIVGNTNKDVTELDAPQYEALLQRFPLIIRADYEINEVTAKVLLNKFLEKYSSDYNFDKFINYFVEYLINSKIKGLSPRVIKGLIETSIKHKKLLIDYFYPFNLNLDNSNSLIVKLKDIFSKTINGTLCMRDSFEKNLRKYYDMDYSNMLSTPIDDDLQKTIKTIFGLISFKANDNPNIEVIRNLVKGICISVKEKHKIDLKEEFLRLYNQFLSDIKEYCSNSLEQYLLDNNILQGTHEFDNDLADKEKVIIDRFILITRMVQILDDKFFPDKHTFQMYSKIFRNV
ncbi:MAG: AAA family ATPase [Candidatus Calescibacterium sp.]|nr:AAA family ATPase [Candidatus Calescibacterium sp.]